MNLLLEKRGYFTKIWFIWFLPACTAQSANASSIIWFTRPVELYIHDLYLKNKYDRLAHITHIDACIRAFSGGSSPFYNIFIKFISRKSIFKSSL